MLRPSFALVLLLVAFAACQHRAAPQPAPATLERRVAARLDSLPAQTTAFAKDLTTGRTVGVRADQPMNTVSVIKLPIMVLAYRDAAAGRLALDERHEIRAEEMRRGTGVLQEFAPGLAPTWRDLVREMIVTSDNTATDIMIARLGRDRVNRMLDSLGYRETRLRETIGDLFKGTWVDADAKWATLTDRAVFEMGFPSDSGHPEFYPHYTADSTRWFGRTTAREISRFLEQLQRGELADSASTAEMRDVLLHQFYYSRLPRTVGDRYAVGHKTGDWPPIIGNDVGIIYATNGPIVIAVFTNQNTGSFLKLEEAIGNVAEDVARAWGSR